MFTDTLKKIILLGMVVIIIAYYFLIHLPLASYKQSMLKEIEDNTQQYLILEPYISQISFYQNEIASKAEVEINNYDNFEHLNNEMHNIFNKLADFKIQYADIETSNNLVTRKISVSFVCNANQLETILQAIYDSDCHFCIDDFNLAFSNNEALVSLGLHCFEYINN